MSAVESSGWHFATENYDTDLHAEIEILRNALSYNPDLGAARHTKALAMYEGNYSRWYFLRRESLECSEALIERFLTDIPWAEGFYTRIVRMSDELHAVYDGIDADTLSELATEKLVSLYRRQALVHRRLLQVAWPIEEMHTTVNSIEDRLKSRILEEGVPLEEHSCLLWTPCPSARTTELQELQGVLDVLMSDSQLDALMTGCFKGDQAVEAMPQKILSTLRGIQQRYGCSAYHGHGAGEPKGIDEYVAELIGHVLDGTPYYEPYADNEAKHGFDDVCERCGMSAEGRSIVSAYASLGAAKTMRRLAELRNYYFIDRMMDVISKRFGISITAMRYMTPEEFCSASQLSSSEIAAIAKRGQGMTYVNERSQETITYGVSATPTDDSFVSNEPAPVNVLDGMSACPGRVIAVARLGLTLADKVRLRDDFATGSVLVSNEPNPDWLEIIRRCGAVISDQGGITCHVAVIARELNIPCIVGTKNATRIIHDGDLLLVDATKGQVQILERRVS